ncbi:hypothetical protein SMF913_25917 [Streptomyces malaysiensis]|uniref:Uncharacterized protein n=1 Tax=Streptomyces malaysiensis TaxID=92644 RepID=A0A2J7YQY9_STRMQ|nr:hypothetical protein SMF913_25917 [Streptomyces malaysiensis]
MAAGVRQLAHHAERQAFLRGRRLGSEEPGPLLLRQLGESFQERRFARAQRASDDKERSASAYGLPQGGCRLRQFSPAFQ